MSFLLMLMYRTTLGNSLEKAETPKSLNSHCWF